MDINSYKWESTMKDNLRKLALVSVVSIFASVFSLPAFADFVTDGFGATPQEAVDMAKSKAMDRIANEGGVGCLGLKDGRLVRSAKQRDGLYYVELYVSKHDASAHADLCKQKINSVHIFGQDLKI